MRGLAPLLACLAVAAAATGARAADIRVHAALDRTQFAVGDSADLGVEIQGAQDVSAPTIGDVDGLSVRYLGPSSQLSITNGRTSASVTHHFSVTATRPGTFTIGPIAVDYDGQHYDAGSVTIRAIVAPPGAAQPGANPGRGAPGGDQLGIALTSSHTRAYLHERIPATLTLTVGAVQVSDVHYPRIPGDGFAAEPLREPTQRREQTPNGPVQVVEFPTTITPLRTGDLTVGPAALDLSVPARGARDPFFDRFLGGDPFAGRRPLTLQSEPLHLEVLPLPDAGRPGDFSGAVGRFEFRVEATPRDVKTGDPVTVTMTIEGDGNLDGMRAPTIAESDALKVYPVQSIPQPQASANTAPANGGRARAVFEQVVIPQRPGAAAVPEPRFSYFDPDAAAYRTLVAPPLALTVRASAEAAEPPIGVTGVPARSPAPETLGRDIVFLKDAPATLQPIGGALYRRRLFWAAQLVPLALWALVALYDRRRRRRHADPRWARFSNAGRSARRAITDAHATLRAGDRAAFYDRLAHGMREYLSAKLDLPPGAVTADTVAEQTRARGVPADVAAGLHDLFATCERVRFAPGSDGDMQQSLAHAESLVRALERTRALGTTAMRVAVVLAMLGVAALASSRLDADTGTPSPTATFFHAGALYGEERYPEAAAEYQRILAAGLESGPLHFNLGNAYFKAGDVGRAVLEYERALRLMPSDPDVRANLRFARGTDDDDEPSLAGRLLFPLARRIATDTLLLATSLLYASVMLLLIVRRLVPSLDRLATRAAATMALLLVVVGSSAAYRLLTVDLPTWAVVLVPQGATVRFEPSASGTAHFEAKTGSLLRVLATREGWAQVTRADGTRGWIASDAIGHL